MGDGGDQIGAGKPRAEIHEFDLRAHVQLGRAAGDADPAHEAAGAAAAQEGRALDPQELEQIRRQLDMPFET